MSINKVIYDGNTLIDLTEDTVDSSNLLAGYTAHDRSGAEITGSFDSSIFVLKAGDTMTGALTLSGAPTSNLHAATKKYVDDNVGVVKQENSTTSASYRLLLSKSANDTTETDQVYKSAGLTYNPYLGSLTIDKIHDNVNTNYAVFNLGNNIPSGTAGTTQGDLRIYSRGSGCFRIFPSASLSSTLTYEVPSSIFSITSSQKYYIAATTSEDGDARKVQQNEISSGTGNVLLASAAGNSSVNAHTKKYYGFRFSAGTALLTLCRYHTGTTTQSGTIELGNSTNNGSVGASYGCIRIYGKNTRYVDVYDKNTALTANRELYFPDQSGTIAITDDLSSYLPLIGGTLTGNLTINHLGGDGSASVGAELTLGNNIEWDQENSSFGYINLYSTGTYKCSLRTANIITSDKVLCLPDKNGTLAITDDLNNYISKSGGIITGGFLIITDTSLESGSASAYLTLGNNVDSTSPGSSFGMLHLYGTNTYKASIQTATLSENRLLYLPNKSGTIAITDDLSGYFPITGGQIGNSTQSNEIYNDGVYLTNSSDNYATMNTYGFEVGTNTANGKYSELREDGLVVKSVDLIRMTPHFAQMFATAIPANANLNTTAYLKVGQYYVGAYSTATTISNLPQADVFTMTVEAPITSTYDDESTTSYGRYRIRTLKYTNGNVWVQVCSAASGSSTWTYGAWQLYVTGYKAGNLQINTTGATFAESYCKQYGKTVNVRAWITGLSTTTQTHTNIITVQLVDMPTTPIRFVFTCWLGNGIAAYAGYGVMNTSGKITLVKAVANSDKASFEFTYNV